ncbi:hypothetical protein I4U23_029328 [Adineta vaga]|nr:hypothetical protein I4U23_029328 [Adineta vaga]
MDVEDRRVILTQPSSFVSSLSQQSRIRPAPTGIRGGGGSYFHLIYGCVAGFCIWCIMEECC